MITAKKKVLEQLTKCYAVAVMQDHGRRVLLGAADKAGPCYLFDEDGNRLEKLWEDPGGVMTLEQFPDPERFIIMTTLKFYSPNDAADAKIAYYMRDDQGAWRMHLLCELPFVHRFGLFHRGGRRYLIACTVKSAHAFKDDWTCPGRVWVAEMPDDITQFDEAHPLVLTPLKSGLTRNHGFTRLTDETGDYALIGADEGVFKVTPPDTPDGEWSVEEMLAEPTSDMLYEDFDGDGEKELLIMSPFHGDRLAVYKDGACVWQYPDKLPFLHAVWSIDQGGKRCAVISCREGDKLLMCLYYEKEKGTYVCDVLDAGAGSTNACAFEKDGHVMVLAANRGPDEIALYELEESV